VDELDAVRRPSTRVTFVHHSCLPRGPREPSGDAFIFPGLEKVLRRQQHEGHFGVAYGALLGETVGEGPVAQVVL
jgi:hypothetical protein